MTRQEAVQHLTGQGNETVTVEFMPRGGGEPRLMSCRQGVRSRRKGGKLPYDPATKCLIPVFDMNKTDKEGRQGSYCCIPIEGILRVKVDGEWELVQG